MRTTCICHQQKLAPGQTKLLAAWKELHELVSVTDLHLFKSDYVFLVRYHFVIDIFVFANIMTVRM